MTPTKNGAVENVRSELNFPKNESTETFDSSLEIIKSTLESVEDRSTNGLGTFRDRDKHKRKGHKPANGKAAILPARGGVSFKCSEKVLGKINGK